MTTEADSATNHQGRSPDLWPGGWKGQLELYS